MVISIISLLIALLLPALSNAKQAAELTSCLSNQHQLGIGVNTMPIDNKGRFHEFEDRNNFLSYNSPDFGWSRWPNSAKVLNWLGYYGPNGNYAGGWSGLIRQGYVEDPQAFYCPADEYRSTRTRDGFYYDGSPRIAYTSYMWNPMHKFKLEDKVSYRWGGGKLVERQAFDPSLYNPSTAIVGGDIIQGLQSVGVGNNGPGSAHRPYWNIARFDGSAERAANSSKVDQRHIDGFEPFDNNILFTEHDKELRILMDEDPDWTP